jgi:hypothetical protein
VLLEDERWEDGDEWDEREEEGSKVSMKRGHHVTVHNPD